MLVVFSPIFVADTKITFAYNFVAPLTMFVDRGKAFGIGVLLTDLSNAFDCLGCELLIAKLNAYELSLPTLRLLL